MTIRRFAFVCIISIVCLGCSSTVNLSRVDAPLAKGDFPAALTTLQATESELEQAQGPIVSNLDVGMLSHFARTPDLSNARLTTAEEKISDAFTKSFTKMTASAFLNDNVKDYPGEDFEDIYLNVFKALNYQALGQTEEAMVEIRRSTEKQQVLKDKYQKQLSGSNSVASSNRVDNVETSLVSIEFSSSALCNYLGMLFSRQLKDTSDMKFYHDQVKESFATQPGLYPFSVPSSLDDELAIPEGKARLNVVAFSGKEPVKEEYVERILLPRGHWMKIALPRLAVRQPEVKQVRVSVAGQEFILEPLESLSAVATNTFLLHKESIYNRTVLRASLKSISSEIVDAVGDASSDREDTSGVRALTSFASLLMDIFNDASESADLRMSHYFPGQARVGGITLDPGVYDVSIAFYNAAGTMIGQVIYQQMHVSADQLNLCEGAYLR